MLFYRLFGGLYLLKSGTHRTFPVLRNIPGKVPLFLVSSVFPYSKGEQGRYKGTSIYGSNPPNAPCSAEHSEEGSIIFNEFSVPLFKGGTGKVWRTFIFPIFQPFYIYLS